MSLQQTHNQTTGAKGEYLAAEYLIQQGYKIINQNWRTSHLEIDIIAQTTNFLAIIEVKTRINPLKSPETSVNYQKQQKIYKATQAYLQLHPCILEIRFDIITIILNKDKPPIITHYPDAFYPNW
jgi:putative endonuclease